jgi:predicted SnoaL-like aldol condensation-catalyzing enzyme
MKILTASLIALSLLAGATSAIAASSRHESATEAANIAKVEAFYDKGLNQKDFDAARPYLGATYTQHNPTAADGVDGFKGFVQFLKDKFPNSHSEIKDAFADGDYVILHVHSVREPGTAGTAIVDIFRLDHGKIVEHWDVRQDVPDKAANNNGMF